jgi:RND family efflux transporter MFP subunit
MSDQLSSDLAALQIARDAAPPSNRGKIIAIVLVLAAAGAGVYFGLVPWLGAKVWKTEVQVTEIALVSPAQASVDLTTTGYVTAQTTSKVGAKIAGRVAKVHVKEGDAVKAGDVLVELDDADQRAALAAAQAKAAAARARAATARARAATARARLAELQEKVVRAKKLAESGALGQADADDLEAAARSLKTEVSAADADADAAEADARAAAAEMPGLELGLGHTKVLAPISGTVVQKPIEVGELTAITNPVPVVELADFSTLVVETDVPEGRLAMIKVGSPCEISLDAFPGKRFRGQTTEIGRRVNRSKATITVKVKFLDGGDEALPDMAARVSFLTKELDAQALKEPPKKIVPGSALADRGGQKVVFVLAEGKVRQTGVTVGEAFGSGFVLVDGPASGTRIVANPAPNLADGQKIKEKTE